MNVAELIDDLHDSGIRLWVEADELRFRAPRGAMTDERRAQLRERRAELLAHLGTAFGRRAVPDPAARHEPFPLTDIQAAYLVGRGDAYPWGGTACHAYVELEGAADLDPARLAAAWTALVAKHDMLRAVVHPDGYQQVTPPTPTGADTPTPTDAPTPTGANGAFAPQGGGNGAFAPQDGGNGAFAPQSGGNGAFVPAGGVVDVRDAPAVDVGIALDRARDEMDHRRDDPSRLPLCRLRITRCPDRTVLHLSVDLLVVDFGSLQMLLGELAAEYDTPGSSGPAPELTFRDYVLAARGLADSAAADRDRAWWAARELPAAPELPVVGSPDPGPSPVRFTRRERWLSAEETVRLRERAAAHGVTASGALLTAFAEVVGRWSRHPRFTLNVPTFTRHAVHPQVGALVGDFTAVELLEVDLTAARPFAERARELGAQLLDDLAHPLCTGSEVLARMAREAGRGAGEILMPVVFTSGLDGVAPAGPGPWRVTRALTQTPQVWIDCQVLDRDGGLAVSWDCRDGVVDDDLRDDAFASFTDVLTRLVDARDDGTWTDDDPVRLPAGQAAVRALIDDTAAPVPPGLLHEPVFARAAATPDAVAVVDVSGSTTYGELAAQADAVAAALTDRGVTPGELVAVVADKGVAQVAAVLGIHRAGAAYLPVELDQPAARRAAIMTDAGVRVALTRSGLVEALRGDAPGVDLIAVDTLPAGVAPTIATAPGDLAYVIYTSGSTGSPKGVMISHEAATNTVADITGRFRIGPDDRVLGLAALGFDLSVYDVFGALAAGATLVLPSPQRRGDPSHWAGLVAEHGVTVWNSVPGQLQMLHDHLPPGAGAGLASLRVAMLSGDWIPVTLPDQVRALVPGLAVHSLGGATEGAIWSIHHPVGTVDPAWPSIPYGTPLTNQTLRALDHRLRPCPDRVTGELYIGGTGVALGYRGDPVRTAERFGVHPVTGERIYRTGDLGRHVGAGDARGQGVLEFLGREDTQVKIRGYRIELAEVEAALHTHPSVGTAAVLVDGDAVTGQRLAAFVAPARIEPSTPDPGPGTAAAVALPVVADDRAEALRAFTNALDEVALDAMADTLAPVLDGGRHTADQVAGLLGALPRHHRIVRRWLRALAHAGRLPAPCDGSWTGPVRRAAGPGWDELARRERELGWSADLLDHVRTCATALPGLLDGSEPVSGLLFPGAPADAVRAAYRDNLAVRGLNAAAGAAVAEIARTHVVGAPLRVLEIGAGIGGLTAEIVAALAGYDVEYLVTDPSPFFVAEARERFADHPWVRFARLEPGADLRAQGLAPHGADVIVAGNALHRCADLLAVLDGLVTLLTPGGRLLLVEQTRDDSPALMVSMEFLEALAGEPVDARRDADVTFPDAAGWRRLVERAGGHVEQVLPAADDPLAGLGQRLLVAAVKRDRARVEVGALTRHLADRLPEYMLPGRWQVLDALPHTGNGKVDRTGLAALLPSDDAVETPGSATPVDERERSLAVLWAELLGRETVGRDEDFFALGGDSLLVARLVGRLRETEPGLVEIEWDVVLRHLLRRPTVAGLAEYLAGLGSAGTVDEVRGPVSPVVGLNGPDDADVTTVLVHAGVGTIMPYRALVTEIRRRATGHARVTGLEVPDLDAFLDDDPTGLIERTAADYARALLDTGARRFHVVGYCLGGLVATEVARTLTEAGADVASFVAISSHAPTFRLDDELLSEYSFAVMMGIDAVGLGFPADADAFTAAARAVLDRSPGVMPDGGIASLTGEHDGVAECFRRLAQVPRATRVARMCEAVPASVGTFSPPQLLRMFRTFRQSVFAITRYRPEPYAGDVAFLRHGGPYPFPGTREGVTRYWEDLCLGDVTVTDIAGDHFTCLADDHVPAVLRHLVDATGGEVLG